MDSSYLPAAVLQRTSSTEQLLRMYNGSGSLQPAQCASITFTPQTVNSAHTAPLYSLLACDGGRAGGRLSFLLQSFESSFFPFVFFLMLVLILCSTPNQIEWFACDRICKRNLKNVSKLLNILKEKRSAAQENEVEVK